MSDDFNYLVDDQDLRIIKNILDDKSSANEFVRSFDESIFIGSGKKIMRDIISYVHSYKFPPTKRVLLENVENNTQLFNEYSYVLSCLDNIDVNPSEFKYDLDKICSRYKEHATLNFKKTVQSLKDQDQIQEATRNFHKEIEKASYKKQSHVQKPISNFLDEFKRDYNNKFHNKDQAQGILTQYKYLDYITNGLQPAEMVIIGGETGAGKSQLLNNLAIQLWMQNNTVNDRDSFKKGYNVLYFSLEMPYKQCFNRTISRISELELYGIRDATLAPSEVQNLYKACEFIEAYPYHFEIVDIPRGVTVEDVEERYLEAKAKFNPDIVVVDYLGLLEDREASGDDWLKLGHIAGKLHEMSRVYGCSMLTAVQLNRLAKNSDNRIGLHRFGRSSLIATHATLCLQIETRPDENQFGDMVVHIIKNRNGALGHFSLKRDFSRSLLLDYDEIFLPAGKEPKVLLPSDASDVSKLLEKYNWI